MAHAWRTRAGSAHLEALRLDPSGGAAARTRLLPTVILGLIAIVGLCTLIDILFDSIDNRRTKSYQADAAAALSFELELANAQSGLRGYVLSGAPDFLAPYHTSLHALDRIAPTVLPKLDAFASKGKNAGTPVSDALETLRDAWSTAIALVAEEQRAQATAALLSAGTNGQMDRLRAEVAGFLDQRAADNASREAWAGRLRAVIHVIDLTSTAIAGIAMIYAFGRIMRAIWAGFEARDQTERLFAMTDMLQSATGQEDTNDVLRATATKLLPGFSGALYVFNNSRDRLDLSTQWGSAGEESVDHLAPASCWALKRGKPHLNNVDDGALRCSHVAADQMTLEIPMAARGELYGLLEIRTKDAGGSSALAAIQPVASAIADAMSLALSSLALRERLRNQALRDPLTGLYNRRFLEEMLDRLCLEAERRKTPVAAIMIDLDHFKKLNDQHGHGAGDAVLRDVASAILSCLRTTDVACRYGGEELAILLPDCTIALAIGKAEQIRSRITEQTGGAGLSVTASLGVAAIPETCVGPADLLPSADAALYQSKQNGRDRVSVAPMRKAAQHLTLMDAGAEPG